MAKGLTDKQRNILEYLIDFQKQNGFAPTIREIGAAFGIGSLRGVTTHLDALVRKGFITRGRASRSIRVTAPDPRYPHVREAAVRLPLAPMGRYVSVPDELAAPATTAGFVIRIGAAGVPGEPIVPGDLMVIRPQETASAGELVAVRSNGGLGVRRAAAGDTDVVGRVVGLIRRY